jgi:hypothetical protein
MGVFVFPKLSRVQGGRVVRLDDGLLGCVQTHKTNACQCKCECECECECECDDDEAATVPVDGCRARSARGGGRGGSARGAVWVVAVVDLGSRGGV